MTHDISIPPVLVHWDSYICRSSVVAFCDSWFFTFFTIVMSVIFSVLPACCYLLGFLVYLFCFPLFLPIVIFHVLLFVVYCSSWCLLWFLTIQFHDVNYDSSNFCSPSIVLCVVCSWLFACCVFMRLQMFLIVPHEFPVSLLLVLMNIYYISPFLRVLFFCFTLVVAMIVFLFVQRIGNLFCVFCLSCYLSYVNKYLWSNNKFNAHDAFLGKLHQVRSVSKYWKAK